MGHQTTHYALRYHTIVWTIALCHSLGHQCSVWDTTVRATKPWIVLNNPPFSLACSLVLHNGLGTWELMVNVEIALKWKHSVAGKTIQQQRQPSWDLNWRGRGGGKISTEGGSQCDDKAGQSTIWTAGQKHFFWINMETQEVPILGFEDKEDVQWHWTWRKRQYMLHEICL